MSAQAPPPQPYFDRLRLKNVRCFRDAEIPLHPHCTVLLGGNGAGKTTIVEALASLTFGKGEGLDKFPGRRKTSRGEIRLYRSGQRRPAAHWKHWKQGQDRQTLLPGDYLFAYGRYRRVFYPDDEPSSSSPRADLSNLVSRVTERRTATLDRPDNSLLKDLSRYVAALHYGARSDHRLKAVLETLNRSFVDLGQDIDGIEVVAEGSRYVPKVIRRGVPLDFREMSDGYQAILVVILDLSLRYPYLFSELDRPHEGRAVVAIDEVGLHLHPRWLRMVVGQLTSLFPNTQFILTTHSPGVVQGAIDLGMGVVAMHEKKGENFVTPRPLSARMKSELKGAEIGSLLVEDRLFGVESRYSHEVSEKEDAVDELQAKMMRGDADDDDRKELAKHSRALKKLIVKEDLRRGDSSTLSRMAEIQEAFISDLAAAIEKAKQ